jgi:hypothetical protein
MIWAAGKEADCSKQERIMAAQVTCDIDAIADQLFDPDPAVSQRALATLMEEFGDPTAAEEAQEKLAMDAEA